MWLREHKEKRTINKTALGERKKNWQALCSVSSKTPGRGRFFQRGSVLTHRIELRPILTRENDLEANTGKKRNKTRPTLSKTN